jgi:ribosomal protein L11 methyltransferase
MVELALRVPAAAAEDVLDRLLPLAPHGVYEVAVGDDVELRVRGARMEMPAREAVAAAAGSWAFALRRRDVSDDWKVRRAADYEPRVVAGRLVVRPEWAPPADDGLIDLVLEESDAFGGGGHPTTWICLEALCDIEPHGSLADLGTGSGVLAIAGALLGFDDVVALERDQTALAAARANVAHNQVAVDVREADLVQDPPARARTLVANVPPEVHAAIAQELSPATLTVIASGVLAEAADAVTERYAAAGMRLLSRREAGGWVALTLTRQPRLA